MFFLVSRGINQGCVCYNSVKRRDGESWAQPKQPPQMQRLALGGQSGVGMGHTSRSVCKCQRRLRKCHPQLHPRSADWSNGAANLPAAAKSWGCAGITRSMCEPGAVNSIALMAEDLITPANNSGHKIRG